MGFYFGGNNFRTCILSVGEHLMHKPRIDELLNKKLTSKELSKLAKKVRNDEVLVALLKNHPNIDFEAIEVSGTRLRNQS